MTAAKRQGLIVLVLMTTMMGFVMSAWFTYQAVGISPSFFSAWAERYYSTYMIVLPTVLVVSPVAQWIATKINGGLKTVPSVKSPRSVAMQAWQHNAQGHRGENNGIAVARKIYEAIASASPQLIYEKPLRIREGDASAQPTSIRS